MDFKEHFRILFTKNAEDDFDRILKFVEYISNEKTTTYLRNDINDCLMAIKVFPQMYPESNYHIHGHKLRKIPIKGYIILYLIDYDQKEIIVQNIFNELEDINNKF